MAEESDSAGADLELDHVIKEFGSFTAVDGISLTIPSGSFFALLGPSGCGKTTTLRMVAGLETPTAGRIRIGGEDVTHTRAYQRPVNTVFQSYALFPHLTVVENVAFGLNRRRVAGATGARGGGARPGRDASPRRAQAVPAVRRPAATRGAGPGDRQQPRGAAARRAAGRARPEAPQADAGRAEEDPGRGRSHLRARHPRPGGGHDHGRHGRGDERGADRADGLAGRPVRAATHGLRGELPRPVQPAARHGRGARRARCSAWTSTAGTCGCPPHAR